MAVKKAKEKIVGAIAIEVKLTGVEDVCEGLQQLADAFKGAGKSAEDAKAEIKRYRRAAKKVGKKTRRRRKKARVG